ncbi:MAG: hypothetical protein NC398_11135 [Acetatifactor muris]|nr:hypothetical protein [Acetatifactor muris]
MKKAIIELLDKMDERKLKLVYCYANSLTGEKSEGTSTSEGAVQAHNGKQVLEKMEEFSVSLECLREQVDLLQWLLGEITCGNVTDKGEDAAMEYINRIWYFSIGLSELARKREKEFDAISADFKKMPFE